MNTSRFPRLLSVVLSTLCTIAASTALAADEPPKSQTPNQPAAEASGTAKSGEKPAAEPLTVDQLIRQLGDKDYHVRQQAQEEIARRGFEAMEALRAATTDDDLEIASRAKYLLRLTRLEWTSVEDSPKVKQLLRLYEHLGSDVRLVRMRQLGSLPNGEGAPALCRLVRFEQSEMLSKAAALALISGKTVKVPDAKMVELIQKKLKDCKRTGAVWLALWSRMGGSPEATLDEWNKLVTAEIELLRKTPSDTSPELIMQLTHFQMLWFEKLGKKNDAETVVQRLVNYCRGDTESITELLTYLIEMKQWKAVDNLVSRFGAKFAADPMLLYMLAGSYADRGNQEEAKGAAERAFKLFQGAQESQISRHITSAAMLRNQGRFDWAKREFEYVIAKNGKNKIAIVTCRHLLAEMLHDNSHDLEAANVLKDLSDDIEARKIPKSALLDRDPKEIESRRQYFLACHWKEKNDLAKQRECIDKALEIDPEDVDALIAGYQLEGQPDDFRAKIKQSIAQVAEKTYSMIEAEPDDPIMYNQYAWLVGNTEGDMDEALRCSQKSLELQPDEGGYLDTLAHVYFGRGDYENAVKNQTRAAELEPHSGLIHKKLEFFKKKLEEKKAGEAKTK